MFSIDGPAETEERRCLVLPHSLNFRDYLAFRRKEHFLEVARCSSDVEDKWIQCRFSMRTENKQKKTSTPESAKTQLGDSSTSYSPEHQIHIPEIATLSESSKRTPTHIDTSSPQKPQESAESQLILQKLAMEKDPLRIVDPYSAPVVPFVAPDLPPGSLSAFPHFN